MTLTPMKLKRMQSGFTHSTLADVVSARLALDGYPQRINRQQIQRYESGRTRPPEHVRACLASLLGAKSFELFQG